MYSQNTQQFIFLFFTERIQTVDLSVETLTKKVGHVKITPFVLSAPSVSVSTMVISGPIFSIVTYNMLLMGKSF